MAGWAVPGYTGLKALGSGGFGDVILARHDASGTLVAIKYLHQDLLADPGFAQMFRGEAAVLAAMDDPNVVRLYEYAESPSGAAIVMELVNGVSLREILAHQGSTTAEAALVVLHGSLLGLAAAHQRGVVHRDYKPENVLVNGDGASKLTDFGIAARAGDRPIPAGTLAYAAPEQIVGAPASPASDVYSATATFYECLTGRPPFTGEAEIIRQQEFEQVPLDPVPSPLQPIVAAGLAQDPQWRPADAAGLVIGLESVAAGAYGPDWADRGRSHLGEAALLLAALWPAGPPPALRETTLQRVSLLRRITPVKAAIAVGTAVAVAVGGAVLASALTHKPPARHHPIAAAATVSASPAPTPTPTPSSSPTPSATPSPTPSPSPSPSTSSSSPPPPPPPPPVVTKSTVIVPGNAGLVDAKIKVAAGDTVTISASGSWTPLGQSYYTGPDGLSTESQDNYLNTTDIGVCGGCATTKASSWGALISYTGGSPPEPGAYTSPNAGSQASLINVVGSYLQTSWPYTGELWLGINDDAYSGITKDNAGQVTAIVTVRSGA